MSKHNWYIKISKSAEDLFLARGLLTNLQKKCQTPRRDILAEANVWTVAADIEGMRYYPQVLIEIDKRPVMVSPSMDAVIMIELTVPIWIYFNSNALKAENM